MADALSFLSSFTDYEQKAADQLGRRSLDLSRMRSLAAELGNPQDEVGALFHVAGSKGKGSVTLTLDQLLRGQELKTGRFLSPHLEAITERIAIDGRDISEESFAALVDRLRPLVARRQVEDPGGLPSFFEAIALMAFLAWKDAGCAAVALEVGLGGRLDATDVVNPACAIITIIDMEHTRVLGDTLAEIAFEKAGILKPGCFAVSASPRSSEAGAAIERRALELGADLRVLDEDFVVIDHGLEEGFRRFDFRMGHRRFNDLRAPVLGRHQVDNIGLALAALVGVSEDRGWQLDELALRHVLLNLRLPARQQFIAAADSGLAIDVLLDTAHTPKSCASLAVTLDDCFKSRKKALLVGMLRDKKAEPCMNELADRFDRLFITTPPSPRAMDLAELEGAAAVTAREGVRPRRVSGHLEDLDLDGLDLLVVTGSVYLAGAIATELRALRDKHRSG